MNDDYTRTTWRRLRRNDEIIVGGAPGTVTKVEHPRALSGLVVVNVETEGSYGGRHMTQHVLQGDRPVYRRRR